ncbi:MAG: DNA gyrase subunit A [Anaerolineales bacterium]|nr:DNA gyrase subunit A [Anaerolineales bacterium]
MEIGLVQRINIDDEMQQAYLDYAMSVIVARALPDARDGLKPVHRRILYAMHDMGLRPDTPYKKSARIVGEVLGKYHPHGDMAVYEAMARMAQDFSMRYRLVDGQGNFGSVDGDAPAAMRYTEARLAAAASQMLADIQKNTVDFEPNFDGTLSEPRVLPSMVPNLLVNGATGIAVGMATSIPPHNLGEVIDAIHYMLEKWDKLDDISVEDLMAFVQGPDFPTGGIIIHEEESDGLISAYSTGRGRVTLQASAHLEEMERGRNRIIITELPYMTNKSSLIERIAGLVREEKLEGIADLRDESDRQGMRIVIELTKTADPQAVLSELYKSTPMQTTISMIMLALVDGEPRHLSLKQALRVFIEHRLEIIRRRSEYDLEKARQRAHILEGLLVALRNLDEIIALIRKSPDADTARDRLMKRFKLSQIQAQAILDMPLRRLAALERKKIEEEYKELQALIKGLEELLRMPKKMRQVIDQELQEVKATFGDRRRTHIAQVKAGAARITLLTASDLKPDKNVWVSVTADGLIARSLEDQPPRLSGAEAPRWIIRANTRGTLYLVTEQGEAAAIPVHSLPEAENPQGGSPVRKVSPIKESQALATLFALPPKERDSESSEEGYLLTATRQGMIKKSALAELPGPSASTFILVRVNPGDRLGWVAQTSGKDELLLVSTSGMAIRFNEEEVRPMGLVAGGVMGIKLQANDELSAALALNSPDRSWEVFLLASDGNAKRTPLDQFSLQGRYGQGLIAWKLPVGVRVIGAVAGKGALSLIAFPARGVAKLIRTSDAPLLNRSARGQLLAELKSGTPIQDICLVETLEPETKTRPKTTPKTGAEKPAKTTSKNLAKMEAKPAAKAAPKPAATSKPPAPAKTTSKSPDKAETEPAAKGEPTAPAKTTSKGLAKAETKPAATSEPPAPAKTTSKSTDKAETEPAAKAAPKPTATSKPPAPAKTTSKSPTKTEAKPAAKPETGPAAKSTLKTPAKSSPGATSTTTKTKAAGKTSPAKPSAETLPLPGMESGGQTKPAVKKSTAGKTTPAPKKPAAKKPGA